jgi:hypothetical protein
VIKQNVETASAASPGQVPAGSLAGAWKAPELPVFLFACLLLALLLLPQSPMLRDLDVGWLIRDGEFIWRHGQLPSGDIYSFTHLGRPWILYKWGFELYLGVLHELASLGGVIWGTALVIALTYSFLLYFLMRLGVNRLLSLGLVSLAILTTAFYWYTRPTTPTYLFYAVFLILLEEYRMAPGKNIWFIPLLFLLWTNVHLGFIVALGAVGLYGLAAWLLPEAFRGPGSRRETKLLFVILPLCLGAVLINPYGISLFVKIWQHSNDKLVTQGLTSEMLSPNFHEAMSVFLFLQITLLFWVGGRDYPGRPVLLALVTVTLALALFSVRHIPYFAITATVHLGHAFRERQGEPAVLALPGPLRQGWGWALAVVLASFLWIVGIEHYKPGFYGFEPNRAPQGAADYLAQQKGARPWHVFSSDDQWGSYFIYRLYPGALVFIDTRFDLYGDAFNAKFLDLRQEALLHMEVLNPWGVDFLVLKKGSINKPPTAAPGWALVYEDSQALIYRFNPK